MRKIIFLAVFCLILSAISFAQVPQKMSYQAVVRGSDNNLVTNQQVAMRVSILQGSVDGTAVYTETHSATTNANGLLTIEIGDGTSNDDFTAINWANGPFFVKTETDVNGGDDYDIIGVSQLLSVPYAMYAQTAGNMPDVSGFLTEEADPTVSDWAKAETKPQYDYSEIQNTPEIPERQVISISNDTIFLSDGGFVKLPPAAVGFSGDYNDLTNRPEIPTVPTNVSAFTNDANYVINEADPTVPAWAKTETKPVYNYSEIEGTPEIPTVPTSVSAFENDANYLQSESDPTVPTWAKTETKPVYNYSEIEGTPEIPTVPTNVSAFTNDANYVVNETDPTIPDWAKADTKPIYNYSEIQNAPANVSAFENDANYVINEADPTVPTWAKAETKPVYNYSEIEGTPEIPTVPTNVSAFENDANYVVNEADPTVPAWAKANAKPTYSYDEITNTPAIPTVPTNVSAFTNDANYVVNEADPTVPDWAKAETKPVYNYSEIEGTPEIPTVPTNVSAFENDANYISTETQTLADVAALGNSLNTQLKNVTDPTDAQDAATKAYVDALVAQLQEAMNNIGGGGSTSAHVPAVTTGTASVSSDRATLSAEVTSDGGELIIARGFFYGTTENNLTERIVSGTFQGIGGYTAFIEQTPNTTYYYKAFAINVAGTSYGEVMSFTTPNDYSDPTGYTNGYGYVDLGLPSGIKWATCNVGASTPTAYGNYYAWGETATKEIYNSSTYTYSDNLTTHPSSADAATANWGSGWRMPTQTEMQELIDNCTVTWTTQNGVNGRLFTGSNGNSIFLPAAGYRYDSSLLGAGSGGYYWSSSLYSSYTYVAWYLYFNSGDCSVDSDYRYGGLSVRAVCQSQN